MISDVVDALYAALAAGDRPSVEALLAADFVADFSPGLPAPIGGRHFGSEAIDSGWWEIGRRYRLRVEVSEKIPTADGRLLVLGHYRPIDAAFAHLWRADADRLAALVQITDTALWLAEPGSRPASHQRP